MVIQLWKRVEKDGEKRGGKRESEGGKVRERCKDREKGSLFLNVLISILLVSSWETENQLEQELRGQMAQHNSAENLF